MFLGTFEPHVSKEGRVTLPKKIREHLGGSRLLVTIGMEPCVSGFSIAEWEDATHSVRERPLFDDTEGRNLRRKIYADAQELELDAQGRFVLPQRLKEYAGIQGDIIIIGAGDHFELWDKTRWEEYRNAMK